MASNLPPIPAGFKLSGEDGALPPVPEGFKLADTPAQPATWKDRVNAAGAGFNSGLAGLVGMPVDAISNVLDLGKAALGTGYTSFTGKAPPKALKVEDDRSNVVGSSAWLRNIMDKNGLTDTQNHAPEDTASRYIAAGASALPSLATGNAPASIPAALKAAGSAAAVGMVPQAVGDMGGDSALQQEVALMASAVPAARSSIPGRGAKPAEETVPAKDMNAAQLRAADVQTLLSNGVRLDNGQRGVGAAAQAAKSAGRAADTVLGSSASKRQQAEDFTSALLRHARQDATRATPDAMLEMRNKANDAYERVHEETPLVLDARARGELESAYQNAAGELGPNSNEASALRAQIDNLYEKAQLTPEARAEAEAAAAKQLEAAKSVKTRQEDVAARNADRSSNAARDAQLQAAHDAQLANEQLGGSGQPPEVPRPPAAAPRLDALGTPLATPPGYEPPKLFSEAPAESAPTAPKSAVAELVAKRAAEAQAAIDRALVDKQAEALPQATEEPARLVSGPASQTTRSALMRLQQSPNGSLKYHAGVLRNVLDDALERSAPTEEAKARIDAAREQWHRFKQIEDMVSGRTDGIITPARANQVLMKKANRGEYIFGKGNQEMADLVRAGKNVLPDIADSGTAARGMDVAKVVAALHNAPLAIKTGATLLGGRAVNELNPQRGTPQGDAARIEAQAQLQVKALRRGAAAATAASAETDNERNRRAARARAVREAQGN